LSPLAKAVRTIPDEHAARASGSPVEVSLPPSREVIAALRAGDEVTLSGPVFTARDATHERLLASLDAEGVLPFGLDGQVLFYAGPTPSRPARPAGSVGPTTAKRMDAATPRLLEAGIAATIGKGPRSDAVRVACARYGAVYFAAVGGAAALLGARVAAARPVAWEDLGTEALVELTLEAFPAFVAIDTLGNDLFAQAPSTWRKAVLDG
jgi:fumarate hydratase subunit beta